MRFEDKQLTPGTYKYAFLRFTDELAPEVLETLKALVPKYKAVLGEFDYRSAMEIYDGTIADKDEDANYILCALDGNFRYYDPNAPVPEETDALRNFLDSRSRRSIPLSASVIDELRKHKRKQGEERLRLGEHYENHDAIFATEKGTPLLWRNLTRRHFKPLLKLAGLPDVRLYDLRHTTASLLLAAGENPKVVSERLGHASIVLTLDTYSHVLPTMQQSATEKLERMLFA